MGRGVYRRRQKFWIWNTRLSCSASFDRREKFREESKWKGNVGHFVDKWCQTKNSIWLWRKPGVASGWKSGYHPRILAKSFLGKKNEFYSGSTPSVYTGSSGRFCRKTAGLKEMLPQGSPHAAGRQTSGTEKDFHIQPVAFWPVQTPGWNARVNLARQHTLQLGSLGSL